MSAFTDGMDKLAAQITESLQGDSVALGDKIDGFKALTPYYVWQMKNAGKDTPDDGLPDFDKFAKAIHEERDDGSDEPGVSSRSRRNGN